MSEPIDVYSDQFQITVGAFGCTLNFNVSPASPPAPGAVPQTTRLATIRMSNEHLKVMAFLIRRQILEAEHGMGTNINVPMQVLNQINISPEDWQAFWGR